MKAFFSIKAKVEGVISMQMWWISADWIIDSNWHVCVLCGFVMCYEFSCDVLTRRVINGYNNLTDCKLLTLHHR